MLAVISDLHFQHVSNDSLRYPRDGKVREVGVRRNLSAGALGLLFSEVHAHAERHAAKEVELVFAGDIFELLRTPLWFTAGDLAVRPTARDLGPDDTSNPLRQMVHRILDGIAADNHRCWPVLRDFATEGRWSRHGQTTTLPAGTRVRVHYLPGNHDRLASAWPSVRARVRDLLAIPPSDAPFPHTLERPGRGGYAVRVRHGHEYDRVNIGVPVADGAALALDDAGYSRPCLGDWVTLEIAARIATSFRVFYARELRAEGALGDRLRGLYAALTEFDDVRPASLLGYYLSKRLGARTDEATFGLLRPVLVDAMGAALADPFFVAEAARLGYGWASSGAVRKLFGEAVRNLTPSSLSWLVQKVQSFQERRDPAGPGEMAKREPGLADGSIEVVVAGHTHHPDQVPLPQPPGLDAEEAFFLDSGTWRTSIRSGVDGTFARIRACTMVFCFDGDERRASGDGRRFETWTGHLAAGDFGPYDEEKDTVGAVHQRVRFERCRVDRVDEGRSLGGAELYLRMGVDGAGVEVRRSGVRDGTSFELDGAVDLHPALDGELWCCGFEVDGGPAAIFDADDPLPWAIAFLERTGDGKFLSGPGALRLESPDGTRLTVEYQVSAPA